MAILRKLRAPAPVRTVEDTKAGHYTVTYKGVHERAFSRTWIRSPKKALELALRKSWDVSVKRCAVYPPAAVLAEIDRLPRIETPGLPEDDD